MALDTAKNFAKVTVSTTYDDAATSIVLTSGHGAKCPTLPANATYFNSTDYADPSDDPNVEIVRATALATDTLTVTRGQEGISASTKNIADKTYKMVFGFTAKVINTDLSATFQPLDATLTALAAYNTSGFPAQTAPDTFVGRTLLGTTNQLVVTNGDGVAGNPTLSLPQNIHTGATPTFAGQTLSGLTAGSVMFAGAGGLVSQDNVGLFWDDANNRLGIRTAVPANGDVHVSHAFTDPSGVYALYRGQLTAKGTATVSDRSVAFVGEVSDHADVVNKTITGMSRSGTTVTVTATAHGFINSDKIAIYGVTHTFDQEVNGAWTVVNAVTDAFDITVASLSAGAYSSGGTATNRPMATGVRIVVAPRVSRGGLTGTAQYGDDLAGYTATNNSGVAGAMATDAYYIGHNAGFSTSQPEWVTGFNADCHLSLGAFRFTGTITGSAANSCAIFNAGSALLGADAFGVLVPNNAVYGARNAAASANLPLFKLNTSNQIEVSQRTHIITGAATIQLVMADSSTDAASKVARMGASHYTNAEEPVGIFVASMSSSANEIVFGGGSSVFNAATALRFNTATTITALTGTERVRIGSADGFDFNSGTHSTYQIRFKNNVAIVGRNAAASADVTLFKINASDKLEFLADVVGISSTLTGSIRSSGATAGIGYNTGAGGAVTQATSKTTGVTLDKVCGAITMNGAALLGLSSVSFTLTNSTIAAADVVVVCVKSGGTAGAYVVTVGAVAAGSCAITVENISAGSLSEAVVLNFVVLKAVAS